MSELMLEFPVNDEIHRVGTGITEPIALPPVIKMRHGGVTNVYDLDYEATEYDSDTVGDAINEYEIRGRMAVAEIAAERLAVWTKDAPSDLAAWKDAVLDLARQVTEAVEGIPEKWPGRTMNRSNK